MDIDWVLDKILCDLQLRPEVPHNYHTQFSSRTEPIESEKIEWDAEFRFKKNYLSKIIGPHNKLNANEKKKMPEPILILLKNNIATHFLKPLKVMQWCTCWTSITNKNMSFKNSPYPYKWNKRNMITYLLTKNKDKIQQKKKEKKLTHITLLRSKCTRKAYI